MAKARKGSKENPVTIGDMEKIAQGKNLYNGEITVISATLNGSFCNYTYDHEVAENTTNTVNIKSGVIVHDDMKHAFKQLHAHLAVICEEISPEEINDIDDIGDFIKDETPEGSLEHKVSHFSVFSFKVNGTGENEGVSLTGQKRLSTGEFVQLSSPKVKWDETLYAFVNELRISIGNCISEVEAYMRGKKAPQLIQQKLALEDSLVEEDL